MAISPTVSLDRVSKSTSSLRSAVSQTGKTTNVIKNTLISGISKKKNLWNSTKIFKTKRNEFERRQAQKDSLFAPSILTRAGGARLLSQQDKSTSITDRLLGFVKYLTAGWILGNLPTWINYGEQFVSRLGTAGAIMSNYGDETLAVMKSIGSIFSSALKNLSAFDFSDNSGLMKTSIGELTDALDDLGTGLSDALGVLFAPFKELPEEPKDEPTPPGTPSSTPPSGPGGKVGTKEQRALLDAIAFAEGTRDQPNQGYKTLFGGGQFDDYSRHPDKVVRSGRYASAAAGRYQFMPATFSRLAKKIGLKDFSPESQDRAALELVKELGVSDNILKKEGMSSRVSAVLGKQWASFPGSPFGQPTKPLKSIQKAYNISLGSSQTTPTTPAPQTRVPPPPSGQRKLQKLDIFTKSLGKDVDFIQIGDIYGSRGGKHKGIDIRVPDGTYIALRVDCEVVASGIYGNYGLLIDVWVPSYGVQLRMAHLSSVLIKSGKIPAGTSFARSGGVAGRTTSGNSTGPHIHFEYDTVKGESRSGGAGDPDAYVRLLLLTGSPNKGKFSPAPKPSAPLVPAAPQLPVEPEEAVEMQNNAYQLGLREGIVQERRGQQILIVDDRGSQIPQKVMTSSGDTLSIQIDEITLLNNFMRNKLLLDLNYV